MIDFWQENKFEEYTWDCKYINQKSSEEKLPSFLIIH